MDSIFKELAVCFIVQLITMPEGVDDTCAGQLTLLNNEINEKCFFFRPDVNKIYSLTHLIIVTFCFTPLQ